MGCSECLHHFSTSTLWHGLLARFSVPCRWRCRWWSCRQTGRWPHTARGIGAQGQAPGAFARQHGAAHLAAGHIHFGHMVGFAQAPQAVLPSGVMTRLTGVMSVGCACRAGRCQRVFHFQVAVSMMLTLAPARCSPTALCHPGSWQSSGGACQFDDGHLFARAQVGTHARRWPPSEVT